MTLIRPLVWPSGVPRTKSRRSGRFTSEGKPITVVRALDRLNDQLSTMNARNVEVCADFGLTQGGKVSQSESKGADAGVVVKFVCKGVAYELPCDTYMYPYYGGSDLAQNIAAIAAHLEAIRAVERHGVATVEQLMGAFQALPPSSANRHWSEVLGVQPTATRAAIDSAYRTLARKLHPDVGGNSDDMAALNVAYDQAKAEVGS